MGGKIINFIMYNLLKAIIYQKFLNLWNTNSPSPSLISPLCLHKKKGFYYFKDTFQIVPLFAQKQRLFISMHMHNKITIVLPTRADCVDAVNKSVSDQ